MTLEERFANHCKNNHLISNNDRILVALSGGKDSVCLFYLLLSLQKSIPFQFGVCHVNHGIRNDTAKRDAQFCSALCEKHKIPFYLSVTDVPAIAAARGAGLEETARMERYRLLFDTAKNNSYRCIATAHTKDDQCETVLFHLLRGTGFYGLQGITSASDLLIRPLLRFSSEEVYRYLDENALPFCFDETNDDLSFARNHIRKSILPQLTQVHPGAKNALLHLSQLATWHSALVKRLCDEKEAQEKILFSSGRAPLTALTILTQQYADYPILYEALSRMTKNAGVSINFERFTALCALLTDPRTGKIIEISKHFRFRITKTHLVFERYETTLESIEYQQKIFPGTSTLLPDGQILTCSLPFLGKVENINKKHLIIQAAFDKIKGDLFIRNLRASDRIFTEGMHKLAKKCLQESGVDAFARARTFVICDQDGIFWLPGYGLCDRGRSSETGEVIRFALNADV